MPNSPLRDSNIALREALYAQAQATKSASGMTDEYEKALAKLAPNARDFVEKVRGLKDEFGDLKKTVQNNLFAGMGDSVAALAKDYLPALTKGLGAISTSTNTGVKDIFMMMRDPRAIADWGDMFDGMAKSMAPCCAALASWAACSRLSAAARLSTSRRSLGSLSAT